MTFEVLDLESSLEIELVELQVFSSAHEDISVLVKGGGVGGGGDLNFLQLLKPGSNTIYSSFHILHPETDNTGLTC